MRGFMKFKEDLEKNYREQDWIYNSIDDWFTTVCEMPLSKEVEMLEKNRIENALYETKGNRSRAAKRLGIGRTLLLHKIKKYQLD